MRELLYLSQSIIIIVCGSSILSPISYKREFQTPPFDFAPIISNNFYSNSSFPLVIAPGNICSTHTLDYIETPFLYNYGNNTKIILMAGKILK